MQKRFFILFSAIYSLASASILRAESGAWEDVKSGTRKIIRGAAKGVKKVANKVEENMDEDDREDAEEAAKKINADKKDKKKSEAAEEKE